MKLVVFTDSEMVISYFDEFVNSKEYEIEFHSVSHVKVKTKKIDSDSFIYIDVSRIQSEKINSILFPLCKNKHCYISVIDSKHRVLDVGTLFHNGLSDYISQGINTEKLTIDRIETVAAYKSVDDGCSEDELNVESETSHHIQNYIHVNSDWSNVEPGNEYTFLFAHIFFDNYKHIEKNYSRAHADKMVNRFQKYLSSVIKEYSGMIWMWMEKSGLILFPFDRRGKSPLELLFKLMLNRNIITLENGFRNELSYRFSLHLGNTVYLEPGKTGTIVSETVNAIFHLGNKYTKPKSIYMTEEVETIVPERAKPLITKAGEFEGREIFSMILPKV
jgi:hypothetical protein